MGEIIKTTDGKTIDDLIAVLIQKHPDADSDLVRKAFEFAHVAHEGQKRKSGEPYIVHPLSAAYILTELGLDAKTIAACILHDVPEDTERTQADIKRTFGKEISFLVEGVTKLGKLKYRGVDRYVENLRRMFIAMAEDVRVILIKFADRIHNLRTLDALPQEKRYRIALESLEIYAPIANRLGIGEMKGELEDLAFPYVYPSEYQWLMKKVNPHFKEKEEFIEKFIAYIKDEFEKHNIHIVAIHGRTKHLFSLYKKLIKYNRDLSKIYDLVAVRIVVDNVAKCYESLGVMHELCKPLKGRIKDFIAQPKPNGYRSLHTTVFSPPQFARDNIYTEIVEIQIRTTQMHEEAEYGVASHWRYKEGSDDVAKHLVDRRLDWMHQLVELQKDVKDEQQLLETLKIDIFQNYIFVFTPRGDVIELPEDATPVDFAYTIHTDLGNSCSGSKINDQIAPLHTKLRSGDVIEIITDPNRLGPSADWLKFVKTNTARLNIRQYVQKKKHKLLRWPSVDS